MKHKSSIYNLAYLTPAPSLYIFGDKTIKTKFGLLISILVIIIFSIFAIYFLYAFLERKDYSIIYSKETTNFQRNFNIEDTLFMFTLHNEPKNTTLLTVSYINVTNDIVKVNPIKYVKCKKKETIPEKFSNMFTDDFISDFFCIEKGQNITISQDPAIFLKQSLLIKVFVCNKTKNEGCKEAETAVEEMTKSEMKFAFVIENDNINHNLKNNQIEPFYHMQTASPKPYSTIIGYYFLQKFTYESDGGWIFEDKTYYYGISIDPSWSRESQSEKEVYNFDVCIGYFEFDLFSTYSEKYERIYTKLQNVIANIGGIFSVVETIGKLTINFVLGNILFTKKKNENFGRKNKTN